MHSVRRPSEAKLKEKKLSHQTGDIRTWANTKGRSTRTQTAVRQYLSENQVLERSLEVRRCNYCYQHDLLPQHPTCVDLNREKIAFSAPLQRTRAGASTPVSSQNE